MKGKYSGTPNIQQLPVFREQGVVPRCGNENWSKQTEKYAPIVVVTSIWVHRVYVGFSVSFYRAQSTIFNGEIT